MEIIPNWHPIFVHFTFSLLFLSGGLYLISLIMKESDNKNQCLIVARWNLWIGMIFTIATVITGLYAYNTVLHDEPSHLAMTDHRNWAIVTALVFFAIVIVTIINYVNKQSVAKLTIVGLFVGMILLSSTAWRGGEVVYRYGLGVMSMPKINGTQGDGHDHDHSTIEAHGSVESKIPQIKVEKDSHDDHSH